METEVRQRRRVLLGAVIIAALLATAVVIFVLDSVVRSFEKRYTIVAVLPSAAGIIDGTPVWVGGTEVGEVTGIAFLPGSTDTLANVALTLEIPRALAQQVRADSDVQLAAARLIGSRVVNIEPGTAAAAQLAAGDTLRPAPRPTPMALMQRAGSVNAALDTVMLEMRALAPQFTERMADTRRALAGMQLAMAEAGAIAGDLRTGAGMATLRDPAFAASLQRAQAHMAALPQLIEGMRARGADFGDVAAALARLQLRADSLSAQLAIVAERTQNGTLQRLQQDTALQRAMNGARAALDSLMAEARRRPLRFVF